MEQKQRETKRCPYCGEWLDEPQPEAKKTKVCPVCGEEIDADAVVCPVCHEIIDDYEKRQKTSKSIAETGLRTSGDAITFEFAKKSLFPYLLKLFFVLLLLSRHLALVPLSCKRYS